MFDQQSSQPNTPNPASPTPAPIAVAAMPMQKKSHKGMWAAILLVFVLVAGAAAAYYYLTVVSVTPEKVMGKMFLAMHDVTSAHADVTITGSGTGISKSPLYTPKDGKAETPIDYTMTILSSFSFDESTKLFDGDFSFVTTAGGESVTNVAADMRSGSDIDYVQLTSFTTPMIPDELAPGIDMALNRWIVLDKNEITKSLGLDALVAQLQTDDQSAEQASAAIDAALAEYLPKIVVITGTLDAELVNGVDTRHYAYSLDKNEAGHLLDALSVITENEDDFEEARAFLGETDDMTGEVWIGKSDTMLYKVTLNTKATTTTKATGVQQMLLSGTLTLSDFGTAVDVVMPESATPVQDLMLEIITKLSEDAKADDDGDGLQNSDEDKYETDRANPDTDGDGFTDGAEVAGGYNPNGEGELSQSRNGALAPEDLVDFDGDTTGLGE